MNKWNHIRLNETMGRVIVNAFEVSYHASTKCAQSQGVEFVAFLFSVDGEGLEIVVDFASGSYLIKDICGEEGEEREEKQK